MSSFSRESDCISLNVIQDLFFYVNNFGDRFKEICLYFAQKLWPSINRCFRRTLKEHYTEDAEEAWQLIFLYICAHMKNGMQNKAS